MRAVSSLPFSETFSNYDAGALAGKRQRRRAADAVRRTGHKGDLAGEASLSVGIHLSALLLFHAVRVQQRLDRATLVHGSVALSYLIQRQSQIENLAGIYRSITNHLDQLR